MRWLDLASSDGMARAGSTGWVWLSSRDGPVRVGVILPGSVVDWCVAIFGFLGSL